MIDFASLSVWINLAIFAGAAAAVWFAGVRITGYAELVSNRTGLGEAVIGMLLLAGVTSLPEIGVTVTAAASGDAPLALNNLFGSIALQASLLAVVDFAIGRRALTSVVPDPQVMLQGALNVLLLGFAAGAMVAGDWPVFGIGVAAWACLALYLVSIWILSRERGNRPWLAATHGRVDRKLIEEVDEREKDESGEKLSTAGLVWRTAAVGAVILVAGYLLSQTGSAIAEQTGLGSSFVGFVLLAFSTSLPELSTALTAARRGLFTMAISDILGTNLINIALVFVTDAVAQGEPVLAQADSFATFGAILGIVITAAFIAGLAERRDTTVGRLGLDSIAVLIAYLSGVVMLYTLRGG